MAATLVTKKDVEDAISWIKSKQKYIVKYRNEKDLSLIQSLWRKVLFSAEGNVRYDLLHPSWGARRAYLSAAINNKKA